MKFLYTEKINQTILSYRGHHTNQSAVPPLTTHFGAILKVDRHGSASLFNILARVKERENGREGEGRREGDCWPEDADEGPRKAEKGHRGAKEGPCPPVPPFSFKTWIPKGASLLF